MWCGWHTGEVVCGPTAQCFACSLHNTDTFSLLGKIFRKLSGGMSLLFLISLLAWTETSVGQGGSSTACLKCLPLLGSDQVKYTTGGFFSYPSAQLLK